MNIIELSVCKSNREGHDILLTVRSKDKNGSIEQELSYHETKVEPQSIRQYIQSHKLRVEGIEFEFLAMVNWVRRKRTYYVTLLVARKLLNSHNDGVYVINLLILIVSVVMACMVSSFDIY